MPGVSVEESNGFASLYRPADGERGAVLLVVAALVALPTGLYEDGEEVCHRHARPELTRHDA